MTSTEITISDKLRAILDKCDLRDGSFVKQLPNWYGREMTDAGRKKMLRLLQKYSSFIPDYQQLYNQVIDEQVSKMIP